MPEMTWNSGQLRNCEGTSKNFHSSSISNRLRAQWCAAPEEPLLDEAERNPGRHQTMREQWHHQARGTTATKLPHRDFSLAAAVAAGPDRAASGHELRDHAPRRSSLQLQSLVHLTRQGQRLVARQRTQLQKEEGEVLTETLRRASLALSNSSSSRRGRGHVVSMLPANAPKPREKAWSGHWATLNASSASCWGETVRMPPSSSFSSSSPGDDGRSPKSLLRYEEGQQSASYPGSSSSCSSISMLSPCILPNEALPANTTERTHAVTQALVAMQERHGIPLLVTKPASPRPIAQAAKDTNPFAQTRRPRAELKLIARRCEQAQDLERAVLGGGGGKAPQQQPAQSAGGRLEIKVPDAANDVLSQKKRPNKKSPSPNKPRRAALRMTDKLAPTHTFARVFKPETLMTTTPRLASSPGRETSSSSGNNGDGGTVSVQSILSASVTAERSAADAIDAIATVVDGRKHAPIKLQASTERYGEFTGVIDHHMHQSSNINRSYGVPSWVPVALRARSAFKLRV